MTKPRRPTRFKIETRPDRIRWSQIHSRLCVPERKGVLVRLFIRVVRAIPGCAVFLIATTGTGAGLPSAELEAVSNITTNSVRVHGTVNGNGIPTGITIQYGAGIYEPGSSTFPYTEVAVPESTSGQTNIYADLIANLNPGTRYYARIRVYNLFGAQESNVIQFKTLAPPEPEIGPSSFVTSSTARVSGSVDPRELDTTVIFEFGIDDGVNPVQFNASVGALEGSINSTTRVPVTAVITRSPPLPQGATVRYRIKATNAGGTAVSDSDSFVLATLSGLEREAPDALTDSNGTLQVNLLPAGILSGWRFEGELEWRGSGTPVSGMPTGTRKVEYRPAPGHIHPPSENVDIISAAPAVVLERYYYTTGAGGQGQLSVILKPDSITTGSDRARWRFAGEGDSFWRDSGTTVSNLIPGTYLVECKPVNGRRRPATAPVVVRDGETAGTTLTYFLADPVTGDPPSVLPFEVIGQDENLPYAHLGQIRGSAGAGTGFVVKPRVVATAAHVIWDDGLLAAALNVQWLHQRHNGVHEPKAIPPRGFYLFDGYATRRASENTPGESSPQSQDRDVAALYFNEEAGRGGFGGFLASDVDENEFLRSNANKMLAGYPVDGIPSGDRGRLHATTPSDLTFTRAFGRTFTTTGVRSTGGSSGAPLCVQHSNGAYYPAAVYLGGNGQSVVRAIDSEVVELFFRAGESANGGQNNTGGGITHTSVTTLNESNPTGAIKVEIRPAGAVAAGARWKLLPRWKPLPNPPLRNSGDQVAELTPAGYDLVFNSVLGYQPPTLQKVWIYAGRLTEITFTYAPPARPEITVFGNGRSITKGDEAPSGLDRTDFGLVPVADGSASRVFTIINTGTSNLVLGPVTIGGRDPSHFSLVTPPATTVFPGRSTSFEVRFDPSTTGLKSALISFSTNDPDENPFHFAIQGNEATDSDADGFTDLEENDLRALPSRYGIGRRVDLSLNFLRLSGTESLRVSGLPAGLVFNASTRRITGTLSGRVGPGGVEIQRMDGDSVVARIPLPFVAFLPARAVVSMPRRFPLTTVRRTSRPQTLRISNPGEEWLTRIVVRPTADFLVTQPARNLGPSGSTVFRVTFRPMARGFRSAFITVTSSAAPRSVPVSGWGR